MKLKLGIRSKCGLWDRFTELVVIHHQRLTDDWRQEWTLAMLYVGIRRVSSSVIEIAYHTVTAFCMTVRNVCDLMAPVDKWEFLPVALGLTCKMFICGRG